MFARAEKVEIGRALRDCHADQHEKGTFCPHERAASALTPLFSQRSLRFCEGSSRLGGRRIVRALVDHLVDETKLLRLVGGEELVALQGVLD